MAKQLINYEPAFSPGTANNGYLDFTTMDPKFNLGKLYAVINVTRNVILYAPGVPTSGIYINTNNTNPDIIYLAQDTSSYSQQDQLNVFYDTDPDTFGPAGSNLPSERLGIQEDMFVLIRLMLVELRLQSYMLQQGFHPMITVDDLEKLRVDFMTGSSGIEGIESTTT